MQKKKLPIIQIYSVGINSSDFQLTLNQLMECEGQRFSHVQLDVDYIVGQGERLALNNYKHCAAPLSEMVVKDSLSRLLIWTFQKTLVVSLDGGLFVRMETQKSLEGCISRLKMWK